MARTRERPIKSEPKKMNQKAKLLILTSSISLSHFRKLLIKRIASYLVPFFSFCLSFLLGSEPFTTNNLDGNVAFASDDKPLKLRLSIIAQTRTQKKNQIKLELIVDCGVN